MIWFVGAGPGAEDLITVRGRALLAEADVVIYAGSLVNTALLQVCKKDCKRYDSAYMTLPEVIVVMEEAVAQKKSVVRLHTGDPSLYGAIKEQMEELESRHIDYAICPGVSSFCGAAAALQAEYTLPDVSQSVIITRAAGRTGVPEQEALEKLAAHQSTMVLFLSMSLVSEVTRQLLAGGYAPETPAAIVYKATWPEEQVFRTTIAGLEETAQRQGITKTALIVVGKVLEGVTEKSRLYAPEFATGIRSDRKTLGRFFNVGVGAGDPEDITRKAERLLKSAQVICRQEGQTAYQIAAKACPEILAKETLSLDTPMSRDKKVLEEAWTKATEQVAEKLRAGLDVAMPVLGDPAVYATASYLQQRLAALGFVTEMANGIPSFVRAAGDCGISLVQGSEPLHLLPGCPKEEKTKEWLALPGTKVFMKLGKQYPMLRQLLEQAKEPVFVVERAGMEERQIWTNGEFPEETGYFTSVIVKEK